MLTVEPDAAALAHAVFCASIDPMIVLDQRGGVIRFNEAAKDELTLPDDCHQQSILNFVPDLEHTMFWRSFVDAVEIGVVVAGDCLEVGRRTWSRYKICPLTSPNGGLVAVNWKSVTHERLLEAALKELDRHNNFLCEVGQVVHFTSDLATNRIIFSPKGVRRFGGLSMRRDVFLARTHPADMGRAAEFRRRVIAAAGSPVEVDIRYLHPADGVMLFRLRAMFEAARAGDSDRIVGVAIVLDAVQEPAPEPERSNLTGEQVRAARGMLGWSVRELAERSNVSMSTIVRLEEAATVSTRKASLDAIRQTVTQAGVRLFSDSDGHPAVSMVCRAVAAPTP